MTASPLLLSSPNCRKPRCLLQMLRWGFWITNMPSSSCTPFLPPMNTSKHSSLPLVLVPCMLRTLSLLWLMRKAIALVHLLFSIPLEHLFVTVTKSKDGITPNLPVTTVKRRGILLLTVTKRRTWKTRRKERIPMAATATTGGGEG